MKCADLRKKLQKDIEEYKIEKLVGTIGDYVIFTKAAQKCGYNGIAKIIDVNIDYIIYNKTYRLIYTLMHNNCKQEVYSCMIRKLTNKEKVIYL